MRFCSTAACAFTVILVVLPNADRAQQQLRWEASRCRSLDERSPSGEDMFQVNFTLRIDMKPGNRDLPYTRHKVWTLSTIILARSTRKGSWSVVLKFWVCLSFWVHSRLPPRDFSAHEPNPCLPLFAEAGGLWVGLLQPCDAGCCRHQTSVRCPTWPCQRSAWLWSVTSMLGCHMQSPSWKSWFTAWPPEAFADP